ncbi:helix-turn-helix domain-containing protein [Sphingobium bisphenolivorans]|uniref:helix-turn-helix domain-containing protein n=1 Tax=Sphingobium bisphenolivorans TaxID=1335760 RepID=UPI0003A6DAAB|nr:helix-turn-helix domain-containing protein [Sphingobium bisphenolivorans]
MSISAIVEPPPASADQRQAVRWRMRLELPGSLDEGRANVIIHDLSTAGMLMETTSRLEVGQSITLSLPEAENATAQIVWQDDHLFGCRFEQPLPQVAISAAKLRNPAVSPAEPPAASPSSQQSPLAERLSRLRQARGMSRTALSARTGFSKPSIWAWETGRTVPRRSNLLALAEAFGLNEEQLLRGDDLPTPPQPSPGGATADRLHAAIDEARRHIAAIAGVRESKVHISIEF